MRKINSSSSVQAEHDFGSSGLTPYWPLEKVRGHRAPRLWTSVTGGLTDHQVDFGRCYGLREGGTLSLVF